MLRAINRVVAILNALAHEPQGLGAFDLARNIQLPVATTFRILVALAQNKFVEQDAQDKRYRLGIGLTQLGYQFLHQDSIQVLARSHMQVLRDKWQESFFQSQFVDGRVVCLDIVHTNQLYRAQFHVGPGREMPLHSSASAKAILAYKPLNLVKTLLRHHRFESYTLFTLTSLSAYVRDLENVRHRKYAVCGQETEIGVVALAVPLPDRSGDVNASLAVVGPAERIKKQSKGLLEDLVQAACDVSVRVGYLIRGKSESPNLRKAYTGNVGTRKIRPINQSSLRNG